MQNKYRPSRKKAAESTAGNKKLIIILTAVLAFIVIALATVLILQNAGAFAPSKSNTIIKKPSYSDKTLYEEDIYSYVILDNGTVMITRCELLDRAVTELTIPSELGGKKVTALGDSSFSPLTWVLKVNIPEGVTYIGEKAFLACGCGVLNLPSTILYIDADAFSVCDIKFVNYPKSREEWKKVTIGSGNSTITSNVTFV